MESCGRDEEKKQQCSWADLDLNMLGEIKKKLYWGDHARFSGVCKTWKVAEHEKRAGDVLPWWLVADHEELGYRITYHLYEPLNMDQPVITRSIDLDKFFDKSTTHFASHLVCFDGVLFFSMYHIDHTSTHFLLVDVLENKVTTLPQFHHPYLPGWDYTLIKAVSTNPNSEDCVFLALRVVNSHHWTLGIFRHGDAHWTATQYYSEQTSLAEDAVFIRGLFYIFCDNQKLASYDISSGELKFNSFSFPTDYGGIRYQKFFAIDGELMLLYYDLQVEKCILTTYDWSHKLWVPLKSLGDRSLFITNCCVYVDSINYYGVSDRIYIQHHGTCYVYSFENGEVLESTSSGLRNWDALHYFYYPSFSMWVEPPALLSKKKNDIGRIEWS